MKLLQTNSGRLRVDPGAVLAIELETLDSAGLSLHGPLGVIILEKGIEIQCTRDEAIELSVQWETYFADLDPDDDDDGDQEDDDDDQPLSIPETIDLSPGPKKLKRRRH